MYSSNGVVKCNHHHSSNGRGSGGGSSYSKNLIILLLYTAIVWYLQLTNILVSTLRL